ncbi:NACHT domain [Fusarium albosuccineum]|uniref:NACHT domain n=1 Tax=Fusarium albosuccineum TaxID=1237068 RepID=A0A8H4KUA5_9HYPO|nr:NACHT domain [Fusarium albosuccineum]
MILTNFVVAAGAIFSSTVSGRPSGLDVREEPVLSCDQILLARLLPALTMGQVRLPTTKCKYEDGGNTKVEALDEAINYGDVLPKDVFAKLKEVCTQTGCSGDNKAEFETTIARDTREGAKYTISAEASFATKGEGTRDNMIDVLSEFAGATTEAREAKQFNIRHEVEGDSGALVSFLNVYIEKEKDENSFCVFLMKALGATTGILHGVAGGGFSLAEIICEVA